MDDVQFMLGLISEKITEGAERQTGRETGMLGLEVVVTIALLFSFSFYSLFNLISYTSKGSSYLMPPQQVTCKQRKRNNFNSTC